MKFDFGENLKMLRKTKGLTQEQVADLLNVSKQSISRWENNTTYPDITFLPILASFYCVTVDSLLGADCEKIQSILDNYKKEKVKAGEQGDLSSRYELAYEMYASFPNEKSVMYDLMVYSYLMGLNNVNNNKKHYLEVSISVSKRFLKMTEDIPQQCSCIKNISLCNKLLGNQEKAISWMQKLPSVWSGVETTAIDVLDGEDKIESIQRSFDGVLHLIHRLFSCYALEGDLQTEERICVLEKLLRLFEIVFEEEDYGHYHVFLSRVYVELAKLCGENEERAGEYAKRAREHAEMYDNLRDGMQSSVLFRNRCISRYKSSTIGYKTESEVVAKMLS